jgi:hypothetical protein
MSHPRDEELEALALVEGGGAHPSADVSAHLAGCAECRAAVEVLRAERALYRRLGDAAEGDAAKLWPGVEQRIAERKERARRRRGRAAMLLGGLAAAAALVLAVLPARRPTEAAHDDDDATSSAETALSTAEVDYRRAISTLESKLPAAAQSSSALVRARRGLTLARAASLRDPHGRIRLIEGYAAYLKSLRRALDSPPGNAP